MALSEQKAELATPRRVTILGSTGSVGCNTVDIVRRDPKQALAGSGIEVAAGRDAVINAAARPADWVMAAIVGAAGLEPTLAAVRRGAMIGLANKETLVCAGELVMAEVAKHRAVMLPVDSEHSAIFQVFDPTQIEAIERIILTASGGPFRQRSFEEMRVMTPEQAVAHPNWRMGAKISVDSASMMNKGLELIEAHHLFGLPESQIDILVHPQSVIHSWAGQSVFPLRPIGWILPRCGI